MPAATEHRAREKKTEEEEGKSDVMPLMTMQMKSVRNFFPVRPHATLCKQFRACARETHSRVISDVVVVVGGGGVVPAFA